MSCGSSSISPSPSHSETFHECALVKVLPSQGSHSRPSKSDFHLLFCHHCLLPLPWQSPWQRRPEYLTGWKILSSFLWWSLCGPLSPCEASSQVHLAPGYFSAMICLGSVLCLVLLAFNSNANFMRMVFSSYRVQIKMPAANDTTPPFKRNAQDSNKAGSTWPLITCLILGKFFTDYEGSVSSSGAWSW